MASSPKNKNSVIIYKEKSPNNNNLDIMYYILYSNRNTYKKSQIHKTIQTKK